MNRAALRAFLSRAVRDGQVTFDDAIAIDAAVIVASERWTEDDTVRFGTISRDGLKQLNVTEEVK